MATKLPVRYDLTCYKGQSYCQNLRYKYRSTGEIFPLTGYTAKVEIRPAENSPRLTAEMVVNVTAADGMISLALTAEQTSSIPMGVYWYDLRTEHDGTIKYWIKGKFIVTGRVTE